MGTAVDTTGINSLRNGPDEEGRFGLYGGRFVAETLMPLILDLEAQYRAAKVDPAYQGRARSTSATTIPAAPARSISPSA